MDNSIISDYFAQPMETEHWIWAMENHVIPWVKAKGKSYFELVRWVSINQRGVLNKIGREKFGELLITLFQPQLDVSDTPYSLKYNMDKFRFNDSFTRFELLPDSHLLNKMATELNVLFDMKDDADVITTTAAPTIESRLADYLHELETKTPYAKVLLHPTYCNFTATISMEHYMTKAFFNLGNPTMIMVYECVDAKVDAKVVAELAGQYMGDRRIKLFIVSPDGYDNRTYSVANERNVGLIQVDPSKPIEEASFVHWRTMAADNPQKILRDMLMGRASMSVPVVIGDGDYICTSLAEVLKRYGVRTDDGVHRVPLYTDEDIEHIAYTMISEEADMYAAQLKGFDYHSKNVPYCEINPYQIARSRGIKLGWKKMSNRAAINTRRHEMSLSKHVGRYSNSEAFSVAHEIGHDEMHSECGAHLSEDEERIKEHQANYFASCLLMPRELSRLMYEVYWKKEYHEEQVRPLRVDRERYFQSSLVQRIIGPCARHLNVSMEAMMLRLHDIGLVVFC